MYHNFVCIIVLKINAICKYYYKNWQWRFIFSCGKTYAFLLPYVFLQENIVVLILNFVNKEYAI